MLTINAYAEDRVVAKFDGKDLKKSEIEHKLRIVLGGYLPNNKSDFDDLDTNTKQRILQEIIQQKVLEDDLNRSKIKDSKLFQQQVEEAKKKVEIDLYMQNFVKRHINEGMIKAEYNNLVNALKNNPEIKLSHILVGSEEEAKKALADIKAGKSFAEEAKEVSTDKTTKERGGEIGYISKGQAFPEVEKTIYSLKAGEISEPVKSPAGWHVLKVDEIKQRIIPEFDKVKTEVEQQVGYKIVNEHLKELAKTANVQIFLNKKEEK